jgi:formate hydrogenlyase subunit 4
MLTSLIFHLGLLFIGAPFLPGVIVRTKATIAGRRGQPLLQLYFDLWKLFKKGMVLSTTTTWIFRSGPIVGFAVPILGALLIPFGSMAAPVSFSGDMILFVYLMALARFFTVLAALDTGSSFEGMGAAREVTFSVLTEPTLFVCFIVLARITQSFSLNGMFGHLGSGGQSHSGDSISLVLVAFCLFIVLLAENCRIPFDDPNTHLELTMIHEVMVLDHSGPDLGLILYGAAMKLMLFAILVLNLILPVTGNILLDIPVFICGLLALGAGIGLVESGMARLRLVRIPQLLIGTTLLSFFALILLLR